MESVKRVRKLGGTSDSMTPHFVIELSNSTKAIQFKRCICVVRYDGTTLQSIDTKDALEEDAKRLWDKQCYDAVREFLQRDSQSGTF